MFKWIAKRWLLGRINKLLEGREKDMEKAWAQARLWSGRAAAVSLFMERVADKLRDGRVDSGELELAEAEFKTLLEAWSK